MISRRKLLLNSATIAGLSPLSSVEQLFGAEPKKRFKIGACDWSLGKSSNVEAFDLAKQIGLDGLMINMGSEKNNLHLRNKSVQQSFLEASKRTGVRISSLAIGELNNVPYKSDPRTVEWVWDSIDVAKELGVPVILLAFFGKNDLRKDAEGKKEVIRRLKMAAPKAEKMGVILGIESYLNAAEHLEIIDAVGSRNVQCYYDFRNTADAGYDTVKEFRQLGRQNICELHIKENGFLLANGPLEWTKVKEAIYETGFYGDGWMQIEGALPKDADIVKSYQHNLGFLEKLFKKKL
ncbi:MAG TPA: sugar phosphate isomerase/epimerase family protein [Chitinophagaceae bacterium]|nr:sugar phosphate isomerase/epimerase family protein [Chitinophagaceae bacterium]